MSTEHPVLCQHLRNNGLETRVVDIGSDRRVRIQDQKRLADTGFPAGLEVRIVLEAESRIDRFQVYEMLLLPLESVKEDAAYHPEGDALYHSLQVFDLARDEMPYDEEFLLAALLHDVGKGIDRRDHTTAGLEALEGLITELETMEKP